MSQSKGKTKPDYYFEKILWSKGIKHIAGVDEVGRGSFAGPVVAGAVVFNPKILKRKIGVKIDDSKKLTEFQREEADKWIRNNARSWGIGEASAAIINRLGIVKATNSAFRKAIYTASSRRELGSSERSHLLIDAFYIPYVRGFPRLRQSAIVKGDEKSFSIAAASILAKVYRDALMHKIGNRRRYKRYKWEFNKGYGTKYHREAILKYGITGYHRKQFVETFLRKH